MLNEKNKTKASQIKASIEYDKRKGLVTIACKVTDEKKILIKNHYEKKGYNSMNEYLIDLINKDMNI